MALALIRAGVWCVGCGWWHGEFGSGMRMGHWQHCPLNMWGGHLGCWGRV